MGQHKPENTQSCPKSAKIGQHDSENT
ncbi:hypothetical protein JOC76_001258 [Neobacillus cucumis]|nr:hypothetical protein [Neobacillus cucumis]